MSAALNRVMSGAVWVSLHTSHPGRSGANGIGRSAQLPQTAFRPDPTAHRNTIDINVGPLERTATATYVALWVDGQIRAVGRLRVAVSGALGTTLYFPPGELAVRWDEVV